MGEIIALPVKPGYIDVTRARASRQLDPKIILPAKEEVEFDIVDEHAAEPIKSLDDIQRITDYLVSKERYRDNMFFVCGINFGLRVSDLSHLVFANLIDDQCCIRKTFPVLEKKTRNTRKVKKNRYLTINDAVVDAVTLYLEHHPCRLDEYMFRSESNRGKNVNTPLSPKSIDRILKGIKDDLHLDMRMSSHSLRKTFGYHQMLMSGNDPRKLLVLQKMFGHSSAAQTLDYIGITMEEIEEAYMSLNLGSKNCYKRFSQIADDVA